MEAAADHVKVRVLQARDRGAAAQFDHARRSAAVLHHGLGGACREHASIAHRERFDPRLRGIHRGDPAARENQRGRAAGCPRRAREAGRGERQAGTERQLEEIASVQIRHFFFCFATSWAF